MSQEQNSSKGKYHSNDEVAMVFKRLFNTTDGKDVLKILEARFENAPLMQNAHDGQALGYLTFARIGEQNVVKYIKAQMNRELGNE